MNEIAPPFLSESWDNSGLQVGDRNWTVKKICLALDATTDVVERAVKDNIDLLITHHPLIFKSIKAIDLQTPLGRIINLCLNHKLAVFSAHTNYDSATGGVNDALAEKIGLTRLLPLCQTRSDKPETYKFIVYVPKDYKDQILESLFQSGCGNIGNYSSCSFSVEGTGTFKPGETSNPSTGSKGMLNHVEEVRIEAVIEKDKIAQTILNVNKVHPYETVAYDIYPLVPDMSGEGLGRIGELPQTISFQSFVSTIKANLNIKTVKTAGPMNQQIRKVVVCSGSGGSLIDRFFQSGADCYVSGDLHYHDAKLIAENGKTMIDIGHFSSEHMVLDVLKHKLLNGMTEKKINIDITCSDLEKDPFHYM